MPPFSSSSSYPLLLLLFIHSPQQPASQFSTSPPRTVRNNVFRLCDYPIFNQNFSFRSLRQKQA
ncbi:Protein of unknown function [Pyronema omphalodes CBS 100304]|uniref:Secreted protein n=1 Tax=Pyronema omphalodes (strain CBS 100304) TaxID=1076935 RepID=U4LTW2_PYROM|nr:Protein of unknown function [Pyronema omphalodes CBS 100304]